MNNNTDYTMTRAEAESIIRKVIASHAGEPMTENLFKDVNGNKNDH